MVQVDRLPNTLIPTIKCRQYASTILHVHFQYNRWTRTNITFTSRIHKFYFKKTHFSFAIESKLLSPLYGQDRVTSTHVTLPAVLPFIWQYSHITYGRQNCLNIAPHIVVVPQMAILPVTASSHARVTALTRHETETEDKKRKRKHASSVFVLLVGIAFKFPQHI